MPDNTREILDLLCAQREAPKEERAGYDREIDRLIGEMLEGKSFQSVRAAREYIHHHLFKDYWRKWRKRQPPKI